MALKNLQAALNPSGDKGACNARQLSRTVSDPNPAEADFAQLQEEIDREKKKLWAEVREHRQKTICCQTLQSSASKPDAWQQCWRGTASAARRFQGTLNASHRLWIVSAEQFDENSACPWVQESVTKHDALKAALTFMVKEATNQWDIIVAVDGRMFSARGVIMDAWSLGKGSSDNWAEFVTLFSGSMRSQRKVFSGSNNTEVGFLRMNVPRVRVTSGAREDGYHIETTDNAEVTSFDLNIVGMPPCRLYDLPLMDIKDKQSILGAKADKMPAKWKTPDMVPLFWYECKSVEWYSTLFGMLPTIGAVVDCSCNVNVAAAAMKTGAKYFGFAKSQKHMQWVSNELDKRIVQYIVDTAHPLHAQSIAEANEVDELLGMDDNEEEEDEDANKEESELFE